jgi:hypothetical protein
MKCVSVVCNQRTALDSIFLLAYLIGDLIVSLNCTLIANAKGLSPFRLVLSYETGSVELAGFPPSAFGRTTAGWTRDGRAASAGGRCRPRLLLARHRVSFLLTATLGVLLRRCRGHGEERDAREVAIVCIRNVS